jgi:hypothetical protein
MKRYNFAGSVKKEAINQAREAEMNCRLDVHHIIPKSLLEKYNFSKSTGRSSKNAIALPIKEYREIHANFDEADYFFVASILGLSMEEEVLFDAQLKLE